MWKSFKGYEGYYEVSDDGRVRGVDRNLPNCKWKGKVLKPDKLRTGYLRYTLSKDGKTERFFAHRMVYQTFMGEIPEGYVVNHIDFDKENNHVENLEAVTRFENDYHSRKRKGWKIDKEDAKYIFNSDRSCKELSEMFGVKPRQILRIKNGKRWFHVNSVPSPKGKV